MSVFGLSELAPPPPRPDDFSAEPEQNGGCQVLRVEAAPFLQNAIAKDVQRRNYVIAPGGRCWMLAGTPTRED